MVDANSILRHRLYSPRWEFHRYRPERVGKVEIYVDGGIRRGNDVIKALALGVTACDIGRLFVCALGAHGACSEWVIFAT